MGRKEALEQLKRYESREIEERGLHFLTATREKEDRGICETKRGGVTITDQKKIPPFSIIGGGRRTAKGIKSRLKEGRRKTGIGKGRINGGELSYRRREETPDTCRLVGCILLLHIMKGEKLNHLKLRKELTAGKEEETPDVWVCRKTTTT